MNNLKRERVVKNPKKIIIQESKLESKLESEQNQEQEQEQEQEQNQELSTLEVPSVFKENDIENEVEEEEMDLKTQRENANANKKNAQDPLEKLISTFYQSNPFFSRNGIHHELEVRFGTRGGAKYITKLDYDNVIKQLKTLGFQSNNENGEYSLRMQNEFLDKYSGHFKMSDNIRVEIYGLHAIQSYCHTNDLGMVLKQNKNAVHFTNKHSVYGAKSGGRIPNVIMEDYNFIVSYKLEEDIEPNVRKFILENWTQFKKQFRYLNRVSFSHPDLPFIADISIVKSSPLTKQGTNGSRYQLFYTTSEAKLFQSQESYEIELEVDIRKIGPGTPFNSVSALTSALKKCVKYILSGLQHTNYPISYTEQRNIQLSYMTLLHGKDWANKQKGQYIRIRKSDFIGPSSYTLQIPNIIPIDENSRLANIRKDFVVTEKADGERHLLYIAGLENGPSFAGKVYLFNTNLTVIFTGAKTNNKELYNTLLDGELILHNKHGQWINLFAAFDIYYLKNIDVRALPFMDIDSTFIEQDDMTEKSKKQKLKQKKEKITSTKQNRYSFLKMVIESMHLVNIVEKMDSMNVSPIRVECKHFYYKSSEESQITDTSIFLACATILQHEKENYYPYTIDGLIFTHAFFGVGSDEMNKSGPLTKITWSHSFKWKPPKYNTIDFFVRIISGKNGEDLIKTKFEDGDNAYNTNNLSQYKSLQLYNSYNEKKHGYINPCQMIYDDNLPEYSLNLKEESDALKPTLQPFYPTNPYDPDAGIANIPLKLDSNEKLQMFSIEGSIIEDNMVVEFSYDFNKEKGWRWIPLRIRHDKNENAYHVALDNWKSIHNPITEEMITTGLNIPETDIIDSDVYYNKTEERTKYLTNNLKIFHNYIKKILIESVVGNQRGQILIDMACGKAGDLPKWISAKLDFVFGIDLSKDNLENPLDGACARYLNSRKKNKIVPDCLFVQGNSAYNIRSTDAMLSEKSVQITNAVFGIGEKNQEKLGYGVYKSFGKGKVGFNIASMQFALHYMFSSGTDLQNFVRNLSECIALNGVFIATFYDGKTIFNMLQDKKMGEMISLQENSRRIWAITKMYQMDNTEIEKMNGYSLSNRTMMPDNINSVGLRIDVFQESINQTISEYLVNFDYFVRIMEEFGFVLPPSEEMQMIGLPNATGMFHQLFDTLLNKNNDKRKYKEEQEDVGIIQKIKEMTDSEKQISFLNRYCVFKKIRNVEAQKIKIDVLGDYNEFEHKKITPPASVPMSGVTQERMQPPAWSGVTQERMQPPSSSSITPIIIIPTKPKIKKVRKIFKMIDDNEPPPLLEVPPPPLPTLLEPTKPTNQKRIKKIILQSDIS